MISCIMRNKNLTAYHPVEPDDVLPVRVVLRWALADSTQSEDMIPRSPVTRHAIGHRGHGRLRLVAVYNGDAPEVCNLADDPTHRL